MADRIHLITTVAAPALTATALANGFAYAPKPYTWEPQHSALAVLAWEDERTNLHGVTGGQSGLNASGLGAYSFSCACGWTGIEQRTVLDASAAIISHAVHTCATCYGTKTATVSPLCTDCEIDADLLALAVAVGVTA